MSLPRLAAAALVCLLALAACTEDGASREEDLLPVDASDDATADTTGDTSGDTAAPDLADTSAPDTTPPTDVVDASDTAADATVDCAAAMLDAPCAPEGASCGGCGPTSCTFCNVLWCNGGVWTRIEAHPDPQCHVETCSPLDEVSRCGSREGCYFDTTLGVFACMTAGTQRDEAPCSSANDCQQGWLCVSLDGPDAGSSQCYQACTPELDDGICGGPCDAMGEHGYTNGGGRSIDDIGFCYFQGG